MIVLVINALLQVYPAWAIGVNHRGSPPNQWRTQDFRIEGVEAPRGVGRGYPPTQIFFVFFCLKQHILTHSDMPMGVLTPLTSPVSMLLPPIFRGPGEMKKGAKAP